MGTSIALAFRGQLRRGHSRKQLALKVVKRTLILFFLGLVISNGGRGSKILAIVNITQTVILQFLSREVTKLWGFSDYAMDQT